MIETKQAVLMAALLLSVGVTQARAQTPTGLEARNELYSIRVLEVSGYYDFRSKFEIRNLATGEPRTLEFTMRALSYKEILMGPGVPWALAVGQLPRGGYSLAVIDLAAARLKDTIACYSYSLAPSGRRLVYVSHYPRMIPAPYRRSILVLYDLAAAPSASRQPEADQFAEGNAGVPLYPRVNRESGSYDPTLSGKEHRFMQPVLWLPGETGIVFLEFRVEDKENFLVRLDLAGDRVSEESEKPVPLEPLVDRSQMNDERRHRIAESGFRLVPRTLEWVEPGRTARLVPWDQPWLQKEILLTIPQSP